MFERYTETARRVIFHARYEASKFGCEHIETEHLLLGILRADGFLAVRLFKATPTKWSPFGSRSRGSFRAASGYQPQSIFR